MTAKTYQRKIQIRFGDCDPAGILYFPRVYEQAHESFEDFIQEAGLPWKEWFSKSDYIVPIRHSECDYLRPLEGGKNYFVQVCVISISKSSFRMQYIFTEENGNTPHAIARIVHTFASTASKEKIEMPPKIAGILKNYLIEAIGPS